MAKPHQEQHPEPKFTQNMEDAARRLGDRAAGAVPVAAEAGQEVARAGADMLKQNVETLQHAWRSGLEAATSVMGRSSEQFGRTLGLSGEEGTKGNGGNGTLGAKYASATLQWYRRRQSDR